MSYDPLCHRSASSKGPCETGTHRAPLRGLDRRTLIYVDMRFHRAGIRRLHHPVVGDLELSYETMELPADAGLNLTVYIAEAGSASQQALDLLASWTARADQADTAGASD
jgi:hypothetical protein